MKINALILFLCLTVGMQAQEMYSYITDKRFKDPSDLIGYNFVPSYMEIPDDSSNEIDPGEYTFGISKNNLYVNGEGIEGVYSVNNINTTEYGYQLLLMNARDPSIQGHLKVILNKYAYVDALVFKRSRKGKEMIFYQAEMPKEMTVEEEAYFTDKWETTLEELDSLWGMEFTPFFRIHHHQSTQERLSTEDSAHIRFYEIVTVIDKTKDRKKRSKKDKKDVLENIEAGPDEAEAGAKVSDSGEELVLTEEEKKKLKIVKEHFVEIRCILTYEDGKIENQNLKYKIKDIKEREDATVGPNGERYQLEIETNKGDRLFLYLTPKRTISSFEMEGFKYLMRGH